MDVVLPGAVADDILAPACPGERQLPQERARIVQEATRGAGRLRAA